MKYIVKWVSLDDIFNYYPCHRIFSDYESAKRFQIEQEEISEQQQSKMEDLFADKIVSEIYLEEIIDNVIE